MEETNHITLLKEFSETPGGRLKHHGPHSGQEYREKVVDRLMKEYDVITFDMSDVFTVAPSFIDEALGVYVDKLGESEFRRRVKVTASDDPFIIEDFEIMIKKRTL